MYHHRHSSGSAGTAAGTGILAAAAAAAVTYFLFGTDKGAEKRERMKEWAAQAKDTMSHTGGEVAEAASELYKGTSSLLKANYAALKNLNRDETAALAERIREHWDEIKEDIEETAKSVGQRDVS